MIPLPLESAAEALLPTAIAALEGYTGGAFVAAALSGVVKGYNGNYSGGVFSGDASLGLCEKAGMAVCKSSFPDCAKRDKRCCDCKSCQHIGKCSYLGDSRTCSPSAAKQLPPPRTVSLDDSLKVRLKGNCQAGWKTLLRSRYLEFCVGERPLLFKRR
jgi:hypothetical protein